MQFHKTQKWKNKRTKILRRDMYLCRECKRYGKSIAADTVHHINPLSERPDLALKDWNLISLCNPCHDKMHDRVTNQLTALGENWRRKVSPPPLTPKK